MDGTQMPSESVFWGFLQTQPPMPSCHGIGYLLQSSESLSQLRTILSQLESMLHDSGTTSPLLWQDTGQ